MLLFAATLFLSAFLLFAAELIVAKMVLPALGGAPMVWNTCVVFFQIVLLGGYVYAHGAATWLGPRRHAVVYAVLLALPLLLLPFSTQVPGVPSGEASPVAWLLLLLLGVIGLPFFVLSTSAAVLQQWFSTTDDSAAQDPYFLYAASNLGSLLALISYPGVVEPTLRLREQSRVWAIGYGAFVVAAYLCAAVLWRTGTKARDEPPATMARSAELDPRRHMSAWRRARWVALSFIPSSLMLAVTSYLSTDIAAVPLLWIVPLSLYLLTFILAFGSRSRSTVAVADRGLPLLILPLAMLMVVQTRAALWVLGPLHLVVFTMAALLCHGELAHDRPSPSFLTEFYFWIAFGGMLGGAFKTLAAPVLFNTVVEYPLVLVLACLFRSGAGAEVERSRGRAMDVVVPLAVGVLTAGLITAVRAFGSDPRLVFAALALPVFVSFSQSRRHPIRFALSLGALLVAGSLAGDTGGRTLYTERTFFGVYRVSVDATGEYRALSHGTTLHGLQAIDQGRRHDPLTYYHRTGPFGQAIAQLPGVANATEIAVVGLGVGSLASYATPGQRWTFFELDPAVERLARNVEYFTYLRDCGDRCRVVLGDARISLADARPNQYGLIVLDAFTSDAIPVHLLTSEAFTLYLSRLAVGGVLAFHISNRHLSLGPVLARLARNHGLAAIEQRERVTLDTSNGKSSSDWVVMAPSLAELGALVADTRWVVPVASGSTPLWTDDSSSILSVLQFP